MSAGTTQVTSWTPVCQVGMPTSVVAGRHHELLVGADVEVVVEAGLVVDAEGDRLAGGHRDVAHLGAGRVGELQGAGGHQLDDAGLAGWARPASPGAAGRSGRSRRLGGHGGHGLGCGRLDGPRPPRRCPA